MKKGSDILAKPKVMTDEEKARCIEIDLPDLIAYKIESDINEDRVYAIPKKYYPFTDERPVCTWPDCKHDKPGVSVKDFKDPG